MKFCTLFRFAKPTIRNEILHAALFRETIRYEISHVFYFAKHARFRELKSVSRRFDISQNEIFYAKNGNHSIHPSYIHSITYT
jgi:hypothetical protein